MSLGWARESEWGRGICMQIQKFCRAGRATTIGTAMKLSVLILVPSLWIASECRCVELQGINWHATASWTVDEHDLQQQLCLRSQRLAAELHLIQ
jgi:hypothetical protein